MHFVLNSLITTSADANLPTFPYRIKCY